MVISVIHIWKSVESGGSSGGITAHIKDQTEAHPEGWFAIFLGDNDPMDTMLILYNTISRMLKYPNNGYNMYIYITVYIYGYYVDIWVWA